VCEPGLGEARQRAEHHDIRRGDLQAPAHRREHFHRRADRSTCEIHQGARDDYDCGDDPAGVVALPDVVDHLGRVDEVVDRHEVEPSVELGEEEHLRHGDEQRATDRHEDRREEERPICALREPRRRRDREVEHERQSSHIVTAASYTAPTAKARATVGHRLAGQPPCTTSSSARHDRSANTIAASTPTGRTGQTECVATAGAATWTLLEDVIVLESHARPINRQ
jgi:hypothetical protein